MLSFTVILTSSSVTLAVAPLLLASSLTDCLKALISPLESDLLDETLELFLASLAVLLKLDFSLDSLLD